jgi:hypothetical protein
MSAVRPKDKTIEELLAPEMKDYFIDLLPDSDRSRLVTTSKNLFAYGLFSKPMTAKNLHLQTATTKLKELLTFIDDHDLAGVIAMLNQDPGLLLLSYKGVFPLQRAYKNWDLVMSRLLKTCILNIREGKDDVIQEQLNPEFIASLGDPNETYHLKSVVAGFTGIFDLENQLSQFRTNIDAIVEARRFPFEAFLHSLDTLKSIRNSLAMVIVTDEFKTCSQFSKQVIGYYQKKAPRWLQNLFLNDTHRFYENLYEFFVMGVIQKLKDRRTDYMPEPEKDFNNFKELYSGLGVDHCISSQGHYSHYWGLSYKTPWLLSEDIAKFRKLFEQLKEGFAEVFPHIAQQATAARKPS